MTPSPEAVAAAQQVCESLFDHLHDNEDIDKIASTIDEAIAPYRERVRRLVEAAREARHDLYYALDRIDPSAIEASVARLDAALAPFLEQETTP